MVEAQSNDLRDARRFASIRVRSDHHAAAGLGGRLPALHQPGRLELVVFTAGGYWTEAGVRVGKYTFRSFPHAGRNPRRSASRCSPIRGIWRPDSRRGLRAQFRGRRSARRSSGSKLFPKKFRTRDLAIDDAFLEKAGESDRPRQFGRPADALPEDQRRDARGKNNKTLADLRMQDRAEVLWKRPFVQLAQFESGVAFRRHAQLHLQGQESRRAGASGIRSGGDAARRRSRPRTTARWSGRTDLGIYGNCVVVDHGYGLQSIYGHLSRFAVKPGDMVKKGQSSAERVNRTGGRRSPAFQHAGGWRAGQSGGMVGRPLDPRPDLEQVAAAVRLRRAACRGPNVYSNASGQCRGQPSNDLPSRRGASRPVSGSAPRRAPSSTAEWIARAPS